MRERKEIFCRKVQRFGEGWFESLCRLDMFNFQRVKVGLIQSKITLFLCVFQQKYSKFWIKNIT